MMIRLAWFVDSMQIGGTELNAIRVLERLDPRRLAVSVYHMGSDGPLLERYRRLGIPLHHIPIHGFLRPATIATGWRIVRSLRAEHVEVVQSHDIYSNIMALPWARLAGVPAVVLSRRWDKAVPSATHARVNAFMERSATAVIANSAAVARALREQDDVAPGRIAVIPNGVAEESFEPFPSAGRTALWRALDLPADALIVGIVARLSPVKDHESLLQALVGLTGRNPQVHGLLIGDGPLRGVLEERVRALGLRGRVHLAGELPNVPNPHGLLDISVLCSLTEGFPTTVVEAMAAGRPVVATAVGGTPEAVVEGVTGLLVPPGSPELLASAIQRLIDSPRERASFGAAATVKARETYHLDGVVQRLTALYTSLVPRP